MKILRIVTVVLFIAVFCVFSSFFLEAQRNADDTIPQIQIEGDILEVSIYDGKEVLLQGVTAYDEKDGDITAKVLVESVSQFTDEWVCTVTYAVADNNQHVAKNTRQIRYIDYVPPKFTLNRSMVFSVGEALDVRKVVGATDEIDGDIGDKVIVTNADFKANTVGTFSLSLQAANSKGDMVYLELPVYVESYNYRKPTIVLKEYLMYVKVGETPDFDANVDTVTSNYAALDKETFSVSEDYDANTPGVYSIHYYANDTAGYQGHAVLMVVVEE